MGYLVGATVTLAFFIALTWVMPEHTILPAKLIVAAVVAFVQVASPCAFPCSGGNSVAQPYSVRVGAVPATACHVWLFTQISESPALP